MEKFGSGMDEIRIRDKHAGSATLYETSTKTHSLPYVISGFS
jgi:hypothetical protein